MASFLDDYNELTGEGQEGVVDAPDTDTPSATDSSEEALRNARKRAMGSMPKPSSDITPVLQSTDRVKNRQQVLDMLDLDEEDIPDPHGAIAQAGEWIEGANRAVILGYASGNLTMEKGRIGYKMKRGEASPDDIARLNEIDKTVSQYNKFLKDSPSVAKNFGNLAPWIQNSMVQGGKGYLIGGIAGGSLALAAGQLGPQAALPEEAVTVPAMTALGGKLASRFLATKDIAEVESGLAYLEMTEMGMDKDKAGVVGDMIGTTVGASEIVGLHFLTKLVPSKVKGEALKGIVGRATRRVVTENAVTRNAARTTGAMAGEATVESVQELTNNIGQTAASMYKSEEDEQDLSPKSVKELGQRISAGLWDTWWATFQGMGVAGAPGFAAGTIRDSVGNNKAKDLGEGNAIVEPDSDENLSGVGEARKPLDEIRDENKKKPTVDDLMGLNTSDTDVTEDGAALSDSLTVTPEQAKVQKETGDSVNKFLSNMRLDAKMKGDRIDVQNNIRKMDTISGLYEEAVKAEDTEEALVLAEQYSQTVSQTNDRLNSLMGAKGQKLAGEDSAVDPNELNNVDMFKEEKTRQAHNMVAQATKAAKTKDALEAMDLADTLQDPKNLQATLVQQERKMKATKPEVAKVNRKITDMLEIKKYTSRETYLSKHVKMDKLVDIKSQLEHQLMDQKEDDRSSTTDQVITQSTLDLVNSTIAEKQEFDETVDEQKRVDALRREQQAKATRQPAPADTRKKAETETQKRQEALRADKEKREKMQATPAKLAAEAKRKADRPAPTQKAPKAIIGDKKVSEFDRRRAELKKQKATVAKEDKKLATYKPKPKAVPEAIKRQQREVEAAEKPARSKKGQPVKTKDLKEDKTSEYTILTSDNPASTEVTPAINRKNRIALKKKLDQMDVDYEMGTSMFEGVAEVPFVIRGLTQAQAKELSNELGQTSFIHAKGDKVALVEGGKANVVKRKEIRLAPSATDYFTKIGKEKFTIPFYTDKSTDLDVEEALAPQVTVKQKNLAKQQFRSAGIEYKGKVYEGKSHLSILMDNPKIQDALIKLEPNQIIHQIKRGFVSKNGEFMDRFDASQALGMKPSESLISEDFLAQIAEGAPGRKAPAVEKKAYVRKAIIEDTPMNKTTQKLIQKSGVKVSLVDGNEINDLKLPQGSKDLIRVANGVYRSGTNEIMMNVDNLAGLSPRQIQSSIAHEALHSNIYKGLREVNPDKFRRSMRTLSNWWADTSLNVDPIILSRSDRRVQGFWGVMNDAVQSMDAATTAMENGQAYAKQNLDRAMAKMEEALTYPFTSPTVAKFLNNVKLDQAYMDKGIKSMWDWFVDHMLKFLDLKVKTGSSLESLRSIANSTLELKADTADVRFAKEDTSFDFGENVNRFTVEKWVGDLDAEATNAVPSVVVGTTEEAEALVGYKIGDNVPSVWIDEHTTTETVYGKGKAGKKVKTVVPAKVIFIAENINSQDHLLSKWMHEHVGHQGLRNTFPNNALLTRFLDQAFSLFQSKDIDTLNEIIELYDIGKLDEKGNRKLTKVDKRLAAEEVIARRAEKLKRETKTGLIAKFKKFVKRWLPKSFLAKKMAPFKMSDTDVMNVLEMSKANVMTSDTQAGTFLQQALDARAPKFPFKGWKTLPDFQFSDNTYMKWIEEVEKEAPNVRKWYEKHQDTLREYFGKDADLFNILLSVTSPQADVNTNVIFAAQTYAYLMGQAEKPGALFANKLKKQIDEHWTTPESMFKNLESINFKVTEFVRGLNGDPDATVGDLWMFRAFFGDAAVYDKEAESYSKPMVVAMRQKIHDLAAKMSAKTGETYTPREIQAAIWININAKSNGIRFDEVADYQSGFNKPSARFDGKSPLEWLKSIIPNLSDGQLSEKLGITEVPMAPISPLAKQRLIQVRNELKAQGRKINKFIVDEDGTIHTSFKDVDEGTLNIIDAIEQGGRRVVVPEDAADWYRETFGFREVSTDKGQTTMKLSDDAVNVYTNPKGKITATQIRQNLGGFSGTYTRVARFSKEAKSNLDKIAKLSQEDKNKLDAEHMKSGTINDKRTVIGKIHEWREQAGLNVDRFIAALEQEFLDTFGGRKTRALFFGTRKQGYKVNTSDTMLLRKAMNLYIDSGAQMDKVDGYIRELSAKGLKNLTGSEFEQLKIMQRMKNMTEEEMSWADSNIRPYYQDFLEFAKEHQIIDSEVANYVKRSWKLPKELEGSTVTWNGSGTTGFKLTPTSGKPRSLDSIIDGWKNGMKLNTEDVMANLQTYANELGYVFANRRFVDYMRSLISFEKDGVMIEFSQKLKDAPKPGPEWSKIVARGFAKPFHDLYARKDVAEILNKMGKTADWDLWDRDTVQFVRRINASIKGTLFAVSVFHHFAGFRSFRYGVAGGTFFDRFRPFKAYRKGLEMLKTQAEMEGKNIDQYRKHIGPVVDYMIRVGGLTVGRVQDWDEAATQESILENFLLEKKGGIARRGLAGWQAMRNAKRGFTNGLFGRLFAGLKANAAASEFVHGIHKMEKKLKRSLTEDELILLAKQKAQLVNADFGGLNLQRMGRNPNLQRAAQMIMLAPDWTESNWRTVTGMFKMPGKKGGTLNDWINRRIGDNPEVEGMTEVYRKFWFQIARRGIMDMIILQGLIMALASDDEQDEYMDFMREQFSSYEKIAQAKWAKLDITPIVGKTKDGKRRSFSVVGHFTDIIKAMVPWKLAAHKTSPLVGLMESFATMTDWKGAPFTPIYEMHNGLVVDNRFEKSPEGFKKMLQIPSWGLYNLRKALPIFVSEFAQAWQGESSWLASGARGIGIDIRDVRHVGSHQLEFEELASEVSELERNLKKARAIRDPQMVRDAKQEIKDFPNYNKIKARIGFTKSQIAIQNNKIKRIVAKQKEDIELTPKEQQKLDDVMLRKREIYSKAMEVLGR